VIKEHLGKEIDMRKDVPIQLSGWSMIVGAIAFLPGAIGMLFYESQTIDWNTPPMQLAAFAVFWAPVLLAVGLLGLRARYKIGGGVLLFGAIVGGLLVVLEHWCNLSRLTTPYLKPTISFGLVVCLS
jgi:hypothetical protein